jgi:hypothetical protein
MPILPHDVSWISHLDISNRNITSLAGIQHFTSLQSLDVSNNQLTELDISNNHWLNTLHVHFNYIASPDDVIGWQNRFSHAGDAWDWWSDFWFFPQSQNQNPDITADFKCPNFLMAVRGIIDVYEPDPIFPHHVNGIDYLDIRNRSITSLAGIEHFTSLHTLNVNNNHLTGLDVSKNHQLSGLYVYGNIMSTPDDVIGMHSDFASDIPFSQFWFFPQREIVDITADFKCPNFLRSVRQQINVPEPNPVFSYHVGGLRTLWTQSSNITSLAGIQHFTSLDSITVSNNQITELDLSKNTELRSLDVRNNNLTKLDISNNPQLSWLNISNNLMTSPDDIIGWTGSTLTFLPQREIVDITADFTCSNFRAVVRNATGIPAPNPIFKHNVDSIRYLDVFNRNVTSLAGIQHFTELRFLVVSNNRLTSLNLSSNTQLQRLFAYNNFIESPADVIGWSRPVGSTSGSDFWFYPQNEPVPPTGISDITRPTVIMLVLLALSAALWAYVLRRKSALS